MQDVVVVQLQNQGNLSGELACTSFQKPERRRIGIATGVNCQLEMIQRIVAGRVRREAPRRAMLEALIDRQDDQLSGTGQFSASQ